MQSILIAPPAAEPVTLAEARSWLRVDTTDEDGAIASLISAAREIVEMTTRRALALIAVIASGAKQSRATTRFWIASSLCSSQ